MIILVFFVVAFEIIGTVAFAFSGAMTAIKKNMDIFGVIVLGVITAAGGGMIRDIILGITPPTIFKDHTYAAVAAITSVAAFVLPVGRLSKKKPKMFETALLVMDSIGLGVFTSIGIHVAFTSGGYGMFLAASVGVVTGVGGGVMRDIFAGDRPYIFVKHVYASASVAGAVLCVCLRGIIGEAPALALCAAVVVVMRLLSAHFRWSLPKAKTD